MSLVQYSSLLSLVCLLHIHVAQGFVPAEVINSLLDSIDDINIGKVGTTLSHDEILRRGVIRSLVRYFYAQKNGSTKIDLNKIGSDYYDVRNLYADYHGVALCTTDFTRIIKLSLQPNVAVVDFDSSTKNLPYVHFDAETFVPSNQRVIDFIASVKSSLASKDYDTARKNSGRILHTIQDFYSHSNWVEMGNTAINSNIGTAAFANSAFATANEVTCSEDRS